MNKYITMDTIRGILTQLFPDPKFGIIIKGEGTDIVSVTITNKTEQGVICVKFTIRTPQKIIELNSLLKCSGIGDDGRGAALLTKVETLARQTGITHITLVDESNIYICGNQIDLAYFKILTTGMSWYNKHGYLSDRHASDMKANTAFIASPIAEKVSPEITKTFPPTSPDETVQSYVTRIFNSIRQQEPTCKPEDIARGIYLQRIVNTLKLQISYKNKLTKYLTSQQGAGRRKLQTKRKKPNKKKRTRKHK